MSGRTFRIGSTLALALLSTGGVMAAVPATQPVHAVGDAQLTPGPQDQGVPYTRSARKFALAKMRDHVVVFPGSRYAYVKGYKVRLDETDLIGGEAVWRDGRVFVPVSFSGVVGLKSVTPPPAPDGIDDRWVYEIHRPALQKPLATIDIDGKPYVDLAAVARSLGLKVSQHPRGLLAVGETELTFTDSESVLLDAVISQFDTPEKFADPDLATKYIPMLARQGKWTDHVKVTPQQLANLNGPEMKWPMTPESAFDYSGLDTRLLGSKVPAPGVFPRVLFSPEDVPALAARVKSQKLGQMSLIEMEHLFAQSFWDPTTDDGKIFIKLATGDLAGLEWPSVAGSGALPHAGSSASVPHQFKGQKPGIYSSHIAYMPECLTTMALYCLLTGDDARGTQVATAIANYFKLREPLIDEWNACSDSELATGYTRPDGTFAVVNGSGSTTHGRGISGVIPFMNLGLALDFSGKWMTPDQIDLMRRVIVKSTYSRRNYGQDGPERFRDVNWVSWDTPVYLALCAIEGLPGHDPEADFAQRRTIRAFCEWGIDQSGVVYESNGKTAGGFQSLLNCMVAQARRGENMFGHPHFRKLLEGQVQMTSPSGNVVVNSGTQYVPFSQQRLSAQFVTELKGFYPNERIADYLLTHEARQLETPFNLTDFDPAAYRVTVAKAKRMRLPSPMYPGFVRGVIFDRDFVPTTRADLNLPLDFNDPVHGVFSAYSDRSPDATWINMMVRPDHYIGAGHHHSDAGMFHFSALGVDWITESPFPQTYDGKYHNQVLVDGLAEPQTKTGSGTMYQAAGTYLGAHVTDRAAVGSADLTNSYTYRWQTQPPQVWGEDLKALPWEMDPSPVIQKMFAGTARYKMRPWWPTSNYSNYIATSRTPSNPMQYVFRSTALVRGTPAYGVVIDDLKKDDASHLYEWTAMLSGGVWRAAVPGLPDYVAALVRRDLDPKAKPQVEPQPEKPALAPVPGEPMLLVVSLSDTPAPVRIETREGPVDSKKNIRQFYDRITIPYTGIEARYRVLLIPTRAGDTLPVVTFEKEKSTAVVKWPDREDRLMFSTGDDGRTRVTVRVGAETVLDAK